MKHIRTFIALIVFVGVVRFLLSVSGVPNSIVRYASMSVIIAIGTIYYAFVCKTWFDRLKAAYFLILPYMIVEVLALGYTVLTDRQTIFHAREYSFGTTPLVHFF